MATYTNDVHEVSRVYTAAARRVVELQQRRVLARFHDDGEAPQRLHERLVGDVYRAAARLDETRLQRQHAAAPPSHNNRRSRQAGRENVEEGSTSDERGGHHTGDRSRRASQSLTSRRVQRTPL
jgi:hypothetical protein